jgi:asparagine synthase (glutamine-hydrolysing)
MCGIVGVFEYGKNAPSVSERVIDDMRETLHHRGPDGAGTWISPDRRVGFGHRRLSILDISGGSQPMIGERGEVLVFNGEIYNYPRLRRELEADGVAFRTTCDTEVILHLYEKYGRDCLQHLNGMFAFALWDPRTEEVFFARDRIGEKPLHWADVNGTLIFGSEIKALLEHPLITPEVNESQVGTYLTNRVTSAPETLYAGIYKLPPGFMAICDQHGVRTRRYWDLVHPREWTDISLDEATSTVRSMLDRSVHERLLSDVPVGVLLSGGLDSTALVALLRDRAKGLATFSVGYDDRDSRLDEREEARRVAREFQTDHHEVVVTERTAVEGLPTLIYHSDEPLADPVALPQHFVCALARQHDVKVVLGGEGSDELFWGYTHYQKVLRREWAMRAIMRLPQPVRRSLVTLTPPFWRFAKARELLSGYADGRPLPMHFPGGLLRHNRAQLLPPGSPRNGWGWAPSNAGQDDGEDLFTQLAFDTQEHEFGLRLPELLLQRMDRVSMANSVEARVPFLDPDLVEFAYRLPPRFKLHEGVHKIVLKRAIADSVPQWVINRPKQGFAAPSERWVDAHSGSLMRNLIAEEGIQRYFNAATIERALSMGKLRGPMRFELWPVLNFALWHKHWIEGEPLDPIIEPLLAGSPR